MIRKDLGRDRIYELAFESEKLLHGNPSGIDQTIVMNGGVIRFQRDFGHSRISAHDEFSILIGNTGIRRSTGTIVARVLAFRDRNPERFKGLADIAARIVDEAERAIVAMDYAKLGVLMNENQVLLSEVGASSPELDKLIMSARQSGAFGAKLTGAGGGGCMICVTDPGRRDNVRRALQMASAHPYEVSVDRIGLKSWNESQAPN
jgi:mevalonate kinase